MMTYAHEHSEAERRQGEGESGFDFRYFVNCSNALFIKAENVRHAADHIHPGYHAAATSEMRCDLRSAPTLPALCLCRGHGQPFFPSICESLLLRAAIDASESWRQEGLRTADSIDYFLMAAWLAMAAAEVDGYRSNSCANAPRPSGWLAGFLLALSKVSGRVVFLPPPSAAAACRYLLSQPWWTDAWLALHRREVQQGAAVGDAVAVLHQVPLAGEDVVGAGAGARSDDSGSDHGLAMATHDTWTWLLN